MQTQRQGPPTFTPSQPTWPVVCYRPRAPSPFTVTFSAALSHTMWATHAQSVTLLFHRSRIRHEIAGSLQQGIVFVLARHVSNTAG